MRLVGLTGGIATGKSTLAHLLRERGVPVVDADELSRAAARTAPVLEAIAREFGRDFLLPDGQLDRKKMGALVFGDDGARGRLEAILHPAIRAAMAEETARLAAEGHPLAVYDTPLLFEAGLGAEVDCVVVIYAPRIEQLERVIRRDGLTWPEAQGRLAAQMDIEEKARRADIVVDNSTAPDTLPMKAAMLHADLLRGLGKLPPCAEARWY
ncbi:MAG TPA: dephospho-CoA kinase [Anaeromyxobacteraceae bacterium]|nr:dephospho-CoA kinase [Anaeromyxobacteraceae bacterium]